MTDPNPDAALSPPFPAGPRDPLLIAARVVVIFVSVMLCIAGAALAVALPAIMVKRADILAEMVAKGYTGAPGPVLFAAAAAVLLGLVAVGLALWFLRLLDRVIGSVGAGDPFAAENATRLSQMGWLVLAVQAIGLPLAGVAAWLGQHARQLDGDMDIDIGFSGDGLVLALVLFILARVFRHGSAMRAELEGTV